MTGWSWKLGRVAGIDVYVHGTFLILLTWIGASHYLAHHRVTDAMTGVVFTLALFGIVVLHELRTAPCPVVTVRPPAGGTIERFP